jgi:exonuclease-1
MGISGLLPLLKSIQRPRHLSEFAGQTVAVDAYVWLHRGAYGCAPELALGKPTSRYVAGVIKVSVHRSMECRYVDYAMHRVRLLRHYGITPYIVFDGGPLPAKQGTEESRAAKRAENLARGKALAAQGRHSQARECFCKCVDVTPQMAFQLIKVRTSCSWGTSIRTDDDVSGTSSGECCLRRRAL